MEQVNQQSAKTNKIKLDFKNSKYATGRRKRSIAKVWVKKGSGNIHVNGLKMNEYFKRPVHQIIVTRPLVCAGKDIGALPGDVGEKIKPYLTPMEESLRYFLGQSHYGLYANERRIRFEPLEVMRGATFHNSYMILDEAQNCTLEQIKMFITRMGEDSKVIINGDIKQTDIRGLSGLQTCIERLKCVDSVATIELTNEDIQRNSIIGEILDALED